MAEYFDLTNVDKGAGEMYARESLVCSLLSKKTHNNNKDLVTLFLSPNSLGEGVYFLKHSKTRIGCSIKQFLCNLVRTKIAVLRFLGTPLIWSETQAVFN